MANHIINSIEEWEALEGHDLGESAYFTIDQQQIDMFADATGDHQWIHVDVERAKRESPYKATIAHGYLTISLLPGLISQIFEARNTKMLINYGIEDLRFAQAVKAGTEVNLKASVKEVKNLRGTLRVKINVRLQIKDSPRPAFTGVIVFLYHY
ncbi:MaoC family dehydratase [bacterium]|nr:MaoC family dehydratase [bacterium]